MTTGLLDRTFAAVVIDWDGLPAAAPSGRTRPVCHRVESLCAAGVHVALISRHDLDTVSRCMHARPTGPGAMLLGINRGRDLYEVSRTGPRLLLRRGATATELDALDQAARLLVDALGEREVEAAITGQDTRRSVVVSNGASSPVAGADIGELPWWKQCGFSDRGELFDLATSLAAQAGLAHARISCGDRYVDIGLTDKSDSLLDVVDALDTLGIGPGLLLIVSDHVGPATEPRGSDSLLIPQAERAAIVSVGSEPDGVPAGVMHLGGGQPDIVRVLEEQLRRIRQIRVPSIDEDPAWTLRESGTDQNLHRVNETLFTIGAGGFGTRGAVEEPSPLSSPMVLAAGVYQGSGAEQHPLPGPNWTELGIDPEPGEDIRVLDMRTGVLYREEVHAEGPAFRSLRLASLDHPGLVAMRAEAAIGRLHPGSPVQPPPGVQAIHGTDNGHRWMRVGAEGAGGIGVVAAQRLGRDGGLRTVERMAAYVAGLRHHPALPDARALLTTAEERGFDRVLAEHRAAWAARWEAVNISIPDDPETERAIRFALFQLWCNTGRYDELAVGARGVSGSGYAGHVFWDAEIYVLPALVSVDPGAAKAMIAYRLHRLEAARMRARASGRLGARFPWESAGTGEDVTPMFGQLAGKQIPILTGEREEHITADVAWAALHCAAWTGEKVTSESREWPLLRETARYWASRCRFDVDGTGHIDGVIGPDEYHESVNDNAFTNAMARWNLRMAADIGDRIPGMEAECRRWRQIAASIVVGYDPSTKLYEQFQGYFDLEPLRVTDFYPPPVAADVVYPRERIAASQSIKQADVLMMHHLIPEDVAPGSLGPNLDFYGPRTAHGSSLSPAITASLLARAGRSDNALSMLRLALGVDLKDLNRTTAGGLHIATLGGIWQAVLTGFLGVRVTGKTMHLDPDLPSTWRSVEVRFHCLKRHVQVHVLPGAVEVNTDGPLRVQLAGREQREITGRMRFER